MQSLKRYFYFGAPSSFDHDFTKGGMNVKKTCIENSS
jgi:hypothetical protein